MSVVICEGKFEFGMNTDLPERVIVPDCMDDFTRYGVLCG